MKRVWENTDEGSSKRHKALQACTSCKKSKTRCELLGALFGWKQSGSRSDRDYGTVQTLPEVRSAATVARSFQYNVLMKELCCRWPPSLRVLLALRRRALLRTLCRMGGRMLVPQPLSTQYLCLQPTASGHLLPKRDMTGPPRCLQFSNLAKFPFIV